MSESDQRISDFRLRLSRQCYTKMTKGKCFRHLGDTRIGRQQGDRTEVRADLMRIGGFVQLKCLVKIHVGRCSFIRKTSKFDFTAAASSYPRLYRYKLKLLSLSLLRFVFRVKQSRDIVKRAAKI